MAYDYGVAVVPERETVDKRVLQAQILEARTAGVSFPNIARQLGLSQRYVYKLYVKALNEIITPGVEQLRKQESERMDQMLIPLMSKIMDARNKAIAGEAFETPLGEIQAAMAISNRRSTLFGLDVPTKARLEVSQGNPVMNILEGMNLSKMDTAELLKLRELLAKASDAPPAEADDASDDA